MQLRAAIPEAEPVFCGGSPVEGRFQGLRSRRAGSCRCSRPSRLAGSLLGCGATLDAAALAPAPRETLGIPARRRAIAAAVAVFSSTGTGIVSDCFNLTTPRLRQGI